MIQSAQEVSAKVLPLPVLPRAVPEMAQHLSHR
jgi:hypothetical protein